MEILTQTDSLLVLQHKPVSFWEQGKKLAMIGVMVSLLPLLAIVFGENTGIKLSCERFIESKINCTLNRFYLTRMETLKISELQAAKVIEKKYKGMNYQVKIIASNGEYLLFKPTLDKQQHQQIAKNINEFITSNQKTLLIKQQDDLQDIAGSIVPFFIIGFIFIALGFYAITLPTVYCTFDKNLNKVAIERKSITNHKIITYPLRSIIEVGIQPFGTKSRLVLTLISQQKILIDKFYSSSKDNVEYLVDKIKYFLAID
ncbi:MAG: hypothetical protein KME64_17525 [Scytonematopsis contorta HA4267-MV1]|jgi:hypothetical protein|nr:hypothetical protein [Scytonematopsis contorta HA4267-MV1]